MKTKAYIDETYFSKINTQKKAYWLGYLFGGGHFSEKINSIKLSVGQKKVAILKKFKNDLKCERSIYVSTKTVNDKRYNIYELDIRSEKLINDIKSYGYSTDYSEITFPDLPSIFKRSFMRGYFESSGNINKHELYILGNYKFLRVYRQHLIDDAGLVTQNLYRKKTKKPVYRIVSKMQLTMDRIIEHLYEED